jgi:hypothetical protein
VTNANDMIFEVGGTHTLPSIGTIVSTFLTDPVEVLRLESDDASMVVTGVMKIDNIVEKTSNAGVTIEGTKMENSGIDMTTATSNPGSTNTI